jgi:large repetitive protein
MKNIILYISILVLFSCAGKKQQDTGLAAYWSFDDTTSAAIKEFSGSGLHVLNKGATQTDGYRGKAMKFDGASVLEVEYIPLLDSFARGITIAAWIKKDTASHWNTIVSREIDSTWSEYMGLAVFRNHVLFSIDPDGKRYLNVMDTVLLTPDKWTHLAGTYDNDTMKLYKNGILIKSAFCKGPFIFQDKNPLFIGGNSNNKNHSTVDCFKGSIDEVRIYKRALVENEIKSLLNQ